MDHAGNLLGLAAAVIAAMVVVGRGGSSGMASPSTSPAKTAP